MLLRRLVLPVLAIAFAAQPVEAASTPHAGPPSQGGRQIAQRLPSRALPAPRIVDVRAIAKRPGVAGGKFASSSPRREGKLASPYASSPGPHAVEAAKIFEGLSLAQNVQLYGPDQAVQPADAQIAASSSWLIEIAGNTMGLFGPDGSLLWTVDLQALFQQPDGNFLYAPSLQYDYGSSRWFLGAIASNTGAHLSSLLVAVSRTDSPLGTWSVTTTNTTANNPALSNAYFIRESIAVVGDKMVQTEQRMVCSSGCSPERQGEFLVLRKDQLLAGASPTIDRFRLGSSEGNFLAVQPQSIGGTYGNIAFLVWLKVGGSPTDVTPKMLGLLQIGGLPYPDRLYWYRGTTTVWEKDFNAVMPPLRISPAQPGGTLNASPTPITSAIYRNGQVVLAINDNCGATPDPRQAYCVRIIKITNFGNATVVANDNSSITSTVPAPISTDLDRTLGIPQANFFDASLAIDPFGRLFVSAAFSSPDLYPGMAVAGIGAPIGPTSTVMPTSRVVNGPSIYSCFAGGDPPWGAYMRSVPDPNDWTRVWMPGEVAVNSCWATAMVSATMGIAPWPVTMTPAIGSTNGSQTVQIYGSYFVPDADQVLFGSTPGIILSESPTSITVVTPPGTAGPVAVTVLTPDGAASAGTFTYITPGEHGGPPGSSGRYHLRR
ncbi:MAG: IPT/TIG domain-containing protein [Candidatus Dormibacteraeota bacterium]|nr:IPT/TIG domain-containing protein [Candidatus Dormibacteraeota bacterium]